MARPTKRITVSEEERLRLERLLKNRSQPAWQRLRIQIVLHCIEGKTLAETAALNKVTQQTVSRWRDRYIAQGFDGLRDRPRSGRPGKYNAQTGRSTPSRPWMLDRRFACGGNRISQRCRLAIVAPATHPSGPQAFVVHQHGSAIRGQGGGCGGFVPGAPQKCRSVFHR